MGNLERFAFWKARRLSKTTEVMLKGLKHQVEVSTGRRLDNLSINNSNCEWTKTHHKCLHP